MSEINITVFADTVTGPIVQLRRAPGTDARPATEKGVVPRQVNIVLDEGFNCSFWSPVATCQTYEVTIRRKS